MSPDTPIPSMTGCWGGVPAHDGQQFQSSLSLLRPESLPLPSCVDLRHLDAASSWKTHFLLGWTWKLNGWD